ncbi:DUF456 domain-containing protein [Streptomyces xiaopingdaonensis]|uniref:DUF456 domain-containing protein n=1 Tax=Streptomyces xiaopingdaonensis TaxID=1565415 RepID=UPI0002FB5595|nr:DUF456 domain-containing protein [Streptomyces xiaopingdaonensis]
MWTAGTLGAWQAPVVGLVLLLGVCGSFLPGVPGPMAVWAAVFWWATAERDPAAWWLLGGSTALLLLNAAVQLLPGVAHGRQLMGRRALLSAGAVGVVGFFAVPVLGGVLGFLLGAYLWERTHLGSRAAALASTRSLMRARGWAVLTELMACLLVAGGWLVSLAATR